MLTDRPPGFAATDGIPFGNRPRDAVKQWVNHRWIPKEPPKEATCPSFCARRLHSPEGGESPCTAISARREGALRPCRRAHFVRTASHCRRGTGLPSARGQPVCAMGCSACRRAPSASPRPHRHAGRLDGSTRPQQRPRPPTVRAPRAYSSFVASDPSAPSSSASAASTLTSPCRINRRNWTAPSRARRGDTSSWSAIRNTPESTHTFGG